MGKRMQKRMKKRIIKLTESELVNLIKEHGHKLKRKFILYIFISYLSIVIINKQSKKLSTFQFY